MANTIKNCVNEPPLIPIDLTESVIVNSFLCVSNVYVTLWIVTFFEMNMTENNFVLYLCTLLLLHRIWLIDFCILANSHISQITDIYTVVFQTHWNTVDQDTWVAFLRTNDHCHSWLSINSDYRSLNFAIANSK